MNLLRIIGTLGFTSMGIVVGCGGSTPGPAVAGTTGAQVAGPEGPQVASTISGRADGAVVERLASARCDQEQTCNNIGAGNKYATRQVCLDQARGNFGNELNAYSCPKGLAQAGVDACLAAVRGEECSHPLQTLSVHNTCRSGAMCMN